MVEENGRRRAVFVRR